MTALVPVENDPDGVGEAGGVTEGNVPFVDLVADAAVVALMPVVVVGTYALALAGAEETRAEDNGNDVDNMARDEATGATGV